MRIVEVAQVQAGDDVIVNGAHHVVEYVEPNGIAYDMQLHTTTGDKVRKCFTAGDIISVEL